MIFGKKEKPIKPSDVKIIILSIFISIFYLIFFYTKANQPSSISLKYRRVNTKLTVEKGEIFKINSILWSQLFKSNYAYSLEGTVARGDCYIKSINIYPNKNILHKNLKDAPPSFHEKRFINKKKRAMLKFTLKHQIYLPKVEIVCLSRDSGKQAFAIDLKLEKTGIKKDIFFILLQASALILFVFILLKLVSGLLFVFHSRFKAASTKKGGDIFSALNYELIIKSFLMLLFMLNLAFLTTYFSFFINTILKGLKTLIATNLSLFVIIAIIFAFLKTRKNKFALLLLFSAVLIINYKFNPEVTGDAVLWGKNHLKSLIWNSEVLGQLINYLLFDAIKFNSFNDIFSLTAKIAAIPYFIFLYLATKKITSDVNKRIIFFAIILTSTYLIFFLGYPEYAYWAIPAQLVTLFLLLKYLEYPKQGHLIGIAISLGIGICLHGSTVLIIPAVFIFLFMKTKDAKNSMKTSPGKSGMKMLLGFSIKFVFFIILILLCFQTIPRILGYQVIYETSFQDSLVAFLPQVGFQKSQLIFFEPDHLKLIGFIFFLTMPSFILWFPYLILKKKVSLDQTTKLIFVFSLFQSFLIFFWNFDYYIRDFDLYLTNTVFCSLFLFKIISDNLFPKEDISGKSKIACQTLTILLLALFSGIGLMVIFTSERLSILSRLIG